ncbi:hypothetical protein D1872_231190 [compost metagenome]
MDVSAGFKQEVRPVPARFIPFSHRRDAGDALFRISRALGHIVHIIPGPVERRHRHALVIQQLLVDHRRSHVSVLRDAVYLAVHHELILQHGIHFVLVLPIVPQVRDIGHPSPFHEQLSFRRPGIVKRRRFVGGHLRSDFVHVVIPIVLHDRHVRIFRLEAGDFIIFLLAQRRFIRQRIMDLQRDLALRDVSRFASRPGVPAAVAARIPRGAFRALPAILGGAPASRQQGTEQYKTHQ